MHEDIPTGSMANPRRFSNNKYLYERWTTHIINNTQNLFFTVEARTVLFKKNQTINTEIKGLHSFDNDYLINLH